MAGRSDLASPGPARALFRRLLPPVRCRAIRARYPLLGFEARLGPEALAAAGCSRHPEAGSEDSAPARVAVRSGFARSPGPHDRRPPGTCGSGETSAAATGSPRKGPRRQAVIGSGHEERPGSGRLLDRGLRGRSAVVAARYERPARGSTGSGRSPPRRPQARRPLDRRGTRAADRLSPDREPVGGRAARRGRRRRQSLTAAAPGSAGPAVRGRRTGSGPDRRPPRARPARAAAPPRRRRGG